MATPTTQYRITFAEFTGEALWDLYCERDLTEAELLVAVRRIAGNAKKEGLEYSKMDIETIEGDELGTFEAGLDSIEKFLGI